MPKRKRSETDDFDLLRKKLRKLEKKIESSCSRRARVLESSSSSPSPTPRESSSNPEDVVCEEHEATHAGGAAPGDDSLDRLLSACSPPPPHAARTPPRAEPAPPAPPPAPPESSTDVPQQVPQEAHMEIELDGSILEILGDDPTAAVVYGKDVHKEIASRFEHFATTGLDKDTRKQLTTKYLVPANCVHIAAPLLNAEIKAALPEPAVKKDKAIEHKQKQMATAISCLAGAITDEINCQARNRELLKKLMDTGRLLCDIQHAESVMRRNFALFSLKKEVKEHLSDSKIDKYVFGANLPETLKSAKAVSKSSSDIKVDPKPAKKPTPRPSQKAPAKNWKTSAPARKQASAPTRRSPAPRATRAPESRRSPRAPPPRRP